MKQRRVNILVLLLACLIAFSFAAKTLNQNVLRQNNQRRLAQTAPNGEGATGTEGQETPGPSEGEATEAPTEAPTEEATEEATEAPTEAPTEEATVPAATEAPSVPEMPEGEEIEIYDYCTEEINLPRITH